MPDRTISILGFASAALFAAYLALVIVTVSLAAYQTDLAVLVHETEGDIGALESQYYAVVERIDGTDPYAVGLVKPQQVTYAVKAAAPALSLR
ncbi:MAG: hypothetical protein AB199_03310 [Parcubacteria bacterium C7867-004]|nr:MAG: hypothetical protein AB199_03310 [Parcubacteria bacterium C7867-004]